MIAAVLVAAAAVPGTAAAEGAVRVEADRAVYAAGEQGRLRVINDTGEAIWLPGCRPFELQAFREDAFRSFPWKPCEHEGVARLLPPGTTEIPFPVEEGWEGRILRPVLTWGLGCREGLPLSQAGCRDYRAVVGPSFRVAGRRP